MIKMFYINIQQKQEAEVPVKNCLLQATVEVLFGIPPAIVFCLQVAVWLFSLLHTNIAMSYLPGAFKLRQQL